MKKLLFAAAMAAGLGMTMPADADGLGGIGGALGGAVGGAAGGLGGALGGVSGAVDGSAGAALGGNVSGGNLGNVVGNPGTAGGTIGNAGTVVSNVAHFGVKSAATATSTSNLAEADARDEIHEIGALDSVSSIAFVEASATVNAEANTSPITASTAEIQAALAGNANVMKAIMAERPDFDVSHVVSADVRANSELVLYTN